MQCTRTHQNVATAGFDRVEGINFLDFDSPFVDTLTPQPPTPNPQDRSRSGNAMKVRGSPARKIRHIR